MVLETLGIISFGLNLFNSILGANASAKAQALQDQQNKLNLKAQKFGIEDQLRQTDVAITEATSAVGSYESFLDWFGGTKAAAGGAFDGLSLADATPDAMKKKETRSAFEQIYNNFAVNDVVAGATGRIGGAQTSMGQTALSALDTLTGTVSQASEELAIYRTGLENLKLSKQGLESVLADINSMLTDDGGGTASGDETTPPVETGTDKVGTTGTDAKTDEQKASQAQAQASAQAAVASTDSAQKLAQVDYSMNPTNPNLDVLAQLAEQMAQKAREKAPSSGGPAASPGNVLVSGAGLEGGGTVEIGSGSDVLNGNDGGHW